MISRRTFPHGTAEGVATVCLPSKALGRQTSATQPEDLLQWVDLRIGTGGDGHCFPSTAVPFGAVQLSPDTYNDGWDWCSGYHLLDNSIMGFSHEDVGQMSAWYILSALGFYSVDPVSGNYILGSPLFGHAKVELGNGHQLVIEVFRSDPSDVYIQSFTLNDKSQDRAWFRHREIAKGGTLSFTSWPAPSATFAVSPDVAPPSLAL